MKPNIGILYFAVRYFRSNVKVIISRKMQVHKSLGKGLRKTCGQSVLGPLPTLRLPNASLRCGRIRKRCFRDCMKLCNNINYRACVLLIISYFLLYHTRSSKHYSSCRSTAKYYILSIILRTKSFQEAKNIWLSFFTKLTTYFNL